MNFQPDIPFVNPALGDYADATSIAIRTGTIGPNGKLCQWIEGKLHAMTQRHAVLTTSGTVALTSAAGALGLESGDEIIVPAYGVISTANAFASMGMRLVPVDVAPDGSLKPSAVRKAITDRTRAVCLVTFGGNRGARGVYVGEMRRLCDEFSLALIEDAACSFGVEPNDLHAHATCYSFAVQKIVTCGQGGAILFERADRAAAARDFISHGVGRDGLCHHVGMNLRMSNLQAALLWPQIETMGDILRRRAALADQIFAEPQPFAPWGGPHYFAFQTDDTRHAIEFLNQRGIQARHQYWTINRHPAYRNIKGSFAMADALTDRVVFLPFGPGITSGQAERMNRALIELGGVVPVPSHVRELDLSGRP